MSPRISSSENRTAAMGVLNAVASAAAHPAGTSALTLSVLSPKRRPSTEAMPAPICTEGPSRPSAMPLASRSRTAQKFAQNSLEGNIAVIDEQRELGLRNAAAAGVRKIARQQIPRAQRAECGDQNATPSGAAGRIHASRKSSGEQNEGYDHQSDQHADDQAEDDREITIGRRVDGSGLTLPG